MKVFNRPMFRKGGSTAQGSGISSLVPRGQFAESNWEPAGDIPSRVFGEEVKTPPLTREQIRQSLFGGKPIPGPTVAEKAFLLSKIAGTPGGLFKKIQAAGPDAMKLLAAQRAAEQKREEDVGTILTKQQLDEREATIKASTPGVVQQNAKTYFDAATKNLQRVNFEGKIYYRDPKTGEAIPQLELEKEALDKAARVGFKGREAYKVELEKAFEKEKTVDTLEKNYLGLVTDKDKVLQELKVVTNSTQRKKLEKNLDNIEKDISENRRQYNTLYRQRVLDKIQLPGTRILKADGGDVMNSSEETMVSKTIEQEDPNLITREKLVELLPSDIGQDVINLLSSNTEALYDFANISTNDDMELFNKKFGTSATLPTRQV